MSDQTLPEGLTPLLLTLDQTAAAMQISRSEVKRMIALGKIPRVKIGRMVRVAVGDIEDWIDRNRKYDMLTISTNVVALRRRRPPTDRVERLRDIIRVAR